MVGPSPFSKPYLNLRTKEPKDRKIYVFCRHPYSIYFLLAVIFGFTLSRKSSVQSYCFHSLIKSEIGRAKYRYLYSSSFSVSPFYFNTDNKRSSFVSQSSIGVLPDEIIKDAPAKINKKRNGIAKGKISSRTSENSNLIEAKDSSTFNLKRGKRKDDDLKAQKVAKEGLNEKRNAGKTATAKNKKMKLVTKDTSTTILSYCQKQRKLQQSDLSSRVYPINTNKRKATNNHLTSMKRVTMDRMKNTVLEVTASSGCETIPRPTSVKTKNMTPKTIILKEETIQQMKERMNFSQVANEVSTSSKSNQEVKIINKTEKEKWSNQNNSQLYLINKKSENVAATDIATATNDFIPDTNTMESAIQKNLNKLNKNFDAKNISQTRKKMTPKQDVHARVSQMQTFLPADVQIALAKEMKILAEYNEIKKQEEDRINGICFLHDHEIDDDLDNINDEKIELDVEESAILAKIEEKYKEGAISTTMGVNEEKYSTETENGNKSNKNNNRHNNIKNNNKHNYTDRNIDGDKYQNQRIVLQGNRLVKEKENDGNDRQMQTRTKQAIRASQLRAKLQLEIERHRNFKNHRLSQLENTFQLDQLQHTLQNLNENNQNDGINANSNYSGGDMEGVMQGGAEGRVEDEDKGEDNDNSHGDYDNEHFDALMNDDYLNNKNLKSLSHSDWAQLLHISEHDLHQQIIRSCRARSLLINTNMLLVHSVAKKFHVKQSGNDRMSMEDLEQEGIVGLIKAAEKFNPDRGVRFSTYACWWIRQSISLAISFYSHTVRLPIPLQVKLVKMRRAESKLQLEYGRKPSRGEIAQELGVRVQKVAHLKYTLRSCAYTSVDNVATTQSVGDSQGSIYVKDLIQDTELRPDEFQEHSFVYSEIISSLSSLTRFEIDTMKLRWGMDNTTDELGGGRAKLQVVAERMNTTVEKIKCIERKAKQLIVKHDKTKGLLRSYGYRYKIGGRIPREYKAISNRLL